MFDRQQWTEMVSMADEIDTVTQLLLCQYSAFMDSQGRGCPKPKVLAKTLDMSEKNVRKYLLKAKDACWLEPININGKKAYRATYPEHF